MTFFRQVTDNHCPDYTVAVDYRPRDPLLTIAIYFLDYGGMQSLQLGRGNSVRFPPQIQDRENLRSNKFEVIGLGDPPRKKLRQIHLTVDEFFISLAAMGAQGQPEFERVHAARP